MYLTPLLRGFPLEYCNGSEVQKIRVMPLQGSGKSFIYVYSFRYDTTSWLTDWPTVGRMKLVKQYRAVACSRRDDKIDWRQNQHSRPMKFRWSKWFIQTPETIWLCKLRYHSVRLRSWSLPKVVRIYLNIIYVVCCPYTLRQNVTDCGHSEEFSGHSEELSDFFV